MLRKSLLLTAVAASFGLATEAGAVPVTFSSDGSFSNIANCSIGCFLFNSGNSIQIGTNNSGPDSILNAIDFGPVSTVTDQNDFRIAEITWINAATPSWSTDQNFNANYNLTITFTQPGNSADTEVFPINIQQPTNPVGDQVSFTNLLVDIAGLSFSLPGMTVSDIHFAVVGGNTAASNFNNGVWYNAEYNTATLRLLADFTATPSIPEPATLALFGAGLLGLGIFRRRRSRR